MHAAELCSVKLGRTSGAALASAMRQWQPALLQNSVQVVLNLHVLIVWHTAAIASSMRAGMRLDLHDVASCPNAHFAQRSDCVFDVGDAPLHQQRLREARHIQDSSPAI